MHYETSDLYEAAYLVAEGSHLANVWQEERGRGSVVFELSGPAVIQLRDLYQSNKAITNLKQFQIATNKLKDVMFALLRSREIQENRLERRKNHAGRHQPSHYVA